jgi:WD40 repeat protein
LVICNSSTGVEHDAIPFTIGDFISVAFAPDSQHLATGSADGTVRYWQMSDAQLLWETRRHEREVKCLTFSPDGSMVVIPTNALLQLYFVPEKTKKE